MFGHRRMAALVAGVALTTTLLGTALVTGGAGAATIWSHGLRTSVAALPVAAEVRTGYSRTLFNHWVDADGDCQNARHEVLVAESRIAVTYTTASQCSVATGQWYSWYDAVTVTSATLLDVDHMVALAEAWDSGAHSWTAAERQAFANDLGDARSLVAVTASVNSSKSDQDPTTWLPANEVCRYVAEWTAVKLRWGLTVDTAERTRLTGLAAGCPDDVLTVEIARGTGPTPPPTTPPPTTLAPPTTLPARLVLTGLTRRVGTAKYADLAWTGPGTRFDLWRGTTRLLRNTTVWSHTNQVTASTTSATFTVCPTGVVRTSVQCSSATLRW